MKNNKTILVIDDEPDLLDNIALALEAENYHVFTTQDGIQALQILQTHPIDLIISDIAMPGLNGYQLYEKVRQNSEWATIPFIFLTARTLDTDVNYGKELGVDDYLTKPIRARELLSVVRGKLRRAEQLMATLNQQPALPPSSDRFLEAGPLRIDVGQHRVWLGEEEVNLSAREFILLEYLTQRAGQVASPSELIKATHDLDTDSVEAGTLLRPLIMSLRRKLDDVADNIGKIENVRGVGYRLIIPES